MRLNPLNLVAVILGGLAWPAGAETLPEPGGWRELPGTELFPVLPSVEELGSDLCRESDACMAGHVGAWTGGAWVQSERAFYFIRPGGHSDGAGADSYRFDMDSLAWARVEPVQELSFINPALENPEACPWPGYGPPATHTYDGVAFLGGGRFLHMGNPGGCVSEMMRPGAWAFVADTTTQPWTWTEVPEIREIAILPATAVADGIVYMLDQKGRWKMMDAETLEVIREGRIVSRIIDGQETRSTSWIGGQMGAAAISGDQFCVIADGFIQCSTIDGTDRGATDDRFGRFQRRETPEDLRGNKAGLAVAPDGRFVIWGGGNDVWTFNPGDALTLDPQDVWHHYSPGEGPESGPGSGTENVYSKWWYDAELDVFAGFNDPRRGVFLFKLPGESDATPPAGSSEKPEDSERAEGPVAEPASCAAGDLAIDEDGLFSVVMDCALALIGAGSVAEPEKLSGSTQPDRVPIGPLPASEVATADFSVRCEGALFCQDFSSPVPSGGGNAEGVFIGRRSADCGIRPTVQMGFLRMYVPSECGSGGGGDYYIDLTQYSGESAGPGESLFIQWRQYMPADLLRQTFVQKESKGYRWTKPKQLIVSKDGSGACSDNQVVVTGQNWSRPDGERYPTRSVRIHNQCRPTQLVEGHGPIVGGSRRWETQPIHEIVPAASPELGNVNGELLGRGCWDGGLEDCFTYPEDQWVTYQLGLTLPEASYIDPRSDREVRNLHVQLWATVDGATTELVIDTIHQMRHSDDPFGAVWLLPFMSYKNPEQQHIPTYTDYDELIVSLQRIPAPGL